jgi:shikimate kinase
VVPAHRAPPPLDGPLAGIKRVAYLMLHKTVARGEVVYPRVAVFMIGLPGSGKSRVIKSRYLLRRSQVNSTQVLDLDAEIEQHPEWDDNDPDRVYLDHSLNAYSWADARVEARFRAAVHDQSVLRLVLDGTGTNLDRQVRRMREAAAAGMFVKAIYVRVPCQTAITRASLRRRPVTAERIRDYYSKMGSALKTARRHAHEVRGRVACQNRLSAIPHTTPHQLTWTCARIRTRTCTTR